TEDGNATLRYVAAEAWYESLAGARHFIVNARAPRPAGSRSATGGTRAADAPPCSAERGAHRPDTAASARPARRAAAPAAAPPAGLRPPPAGTRTPRPARPRPSAG